MLSFHNDENLKQKYVDRVKEHQHADEIIKGTYWEKGKGCAVGCTIHSGDHQAYEAQLGLPEWLARVEDNLFEGMSNADAKQFPLRLLESINVGSDLSEAKSQFLVVVLEFSLKQFDNDKNLDCTKAITNVIHFYKTGEGNIEELRQAAYSAAAYSAVYRADDAAYYAARAAAYYAASYAAAGAAADAADAFYAADAAARQEEAFKYFADQLIDILKKIK